MLRMVVLLLVTLFVIAGCSSGQAVVTPESKDISTAPGSLDTLSIIDGTSYSDGTFQTLGLMGVYELRIDPKAMTADLVSKRDPSALGASWTVSGIGFFTIAPCSHCLKIDSISLTVENYLQLKFKISHPFPKGNPSNPPTGINRLDLDVFDLALVIVPMGTTATTFAKIGADVYSGILVNNTGYTTELKNVAGDDNAMPYVLVIDDSISGTSTWNKFAMGTVDSFFDVFFDLTAMTPLSFDMYLTMGYGQSAQGKSQRLIPTYFNPEFNKKQAWKVVVTPPQGTAPPAIGNTWQHNDPTTTYNVKVEVYDWQHGVTTIANPPVNNGDIAKASNTSLVSVEILGMNLMSATAAIPVSGTGAPNSPLVFEVPVANENLLSAGEYLGLVKVADERVPETAPPGGGIDFLIDSPNGITLTNYAIPEYATYQTFIATVVVGCGPITGSISSPTCPVNNVVNNETIDFVVSASSASGGFPVTQYDCDYDYNGTTFTQDFTNSTGVFDDVGPFIVPTPCTANVPHAFVVAFRGHDSCSPPNVTIFATCTVTVTSCCVNPTVSSITPNQFYICPGTYTGVSISGTNFQGSGGVTQIWLTDGTTTINASTIVTVSDTQATCTFTIGTDFATAASGLYDVGVRTQCDGIGADLATIEQNILYYMDFADGNGDCESLVGFKYCPSASPPRWEEYTCNTNYPQNNVYPGIGNYCARMVTPTFNVPPYGTSAGQCNDVTFSMRHSAYIEYSGSFPPWGTVCWDGAVAGWTSDGGTTFYGDTGDGNNYWKYESGQNYNNAYDYWYAIYSPYGVDCITDKANWTGWTNRNWSGSFGSLGDGDWSQFHLTGGENLFGMSDAEFMVCFQADEYVSYRGWEIYELLVYYER